MVRAIGLKLLIATGEAAPNADAVPTGVRTLIDSADDILVMSPALPGRLEWLASATDRAHEQADERLESVLGHLDDLGASASGSVGSDDPVEAFADAVRDFSPDHILVALREPQQAGWQERGLVESLLERFPVPVTVFRL